MHVCIACMYMYMYVSMYLFTYACMDACIHAYMQAMHASMQACMNESLHIFTYTGGRDTPIRRPSPAPVMPPSHMKLVPGEAATTQDTAATVAAVST